MTARAPNINRYWADLIISELLRCGVTDFAVAPGSRNSPIVTALAARPECRTVLHFDERGTAFFALGAASRTGRPAVWITTSGSAVANGFPAVVEASQSAVPLILLTADRPFELRDVGANQAIDQVKIFGSYPRWSVDLPAPDPAVSPAAVLTTIDQAFIRASGPPAGPVHVNVPFREPLAPSLEPFQVDEKDIASWLASDRPYASQTGARLVADLADLAEIQEGLEQARRGLIVVGGIRDRVEADTILALAERWGWPVLADVTSQMRLGSRSDLVVTAPHFRSRFAGHARPDVVIGFGDRISSKYIQAYLRDSGAGVIAVVSDRLSRNDPDHIATHRITADAAFFAEAAGGWHGTSDAEWRRAWSGSPAVDDVLDRLTADEAEVSEPGVARRLTQLVPAESVFFLASSMPVRDVDMFADPNGASCWVGSNRGASGIDGTVASGVGAARSSAQRATILLGDLALLYDLNSLSLASGRKDIIVAVNNDGGGIFSFLPIHDHPDVFERWFGTPHGLTFNSAAEMFGFHYERPSTMGAFAEAYRAALERNGPSLIEVTTRRDQNLALHRRVEAEVGEALT